MNLDYPEVVAEYGHLRQQLERTLARMRQDIPPHLLFDLFGSFTVKTSHGYMAKEISDIIKALQSQGY